MERPLNWHPRPESDANLGRPPPVRRPGDLEGYLLPSYVDLRAARSRIAGDGIRALHALEPADLEQHHRDNSWRPWHANPIFNDMHRANDAAWEKFMATPEGRRGQAIAQAVLREHQARWPENIIAPGWRARG